MKRVQGIKIARDASMINHLLFADDCLLFVKAELRQLATMKSLFRDYERLAGQKINFSKSELMGNANIGHTLLRVYGEYMDMKIVDGITIYLGLPLAMERSKRETFRWLEDRVQEEVQEWNTSYLSQAGKEALIKSCVQAYPVFCYVLFQVPQQEL